MDIYKRNRLIILIGLLLFVLIVAGYFIWTMTSENVRNIEPEVVTEEPKRIMVDGPYDYSIFQLPVGYANFREALNNISLFVSFDPEYVLSKLPKKIENIVFNEQGTKAVVFESDRVSLFDVQTNTLSEIYGLEGGWGTGDFEGDFYTIGYDEASKQDALRVISLSEGTFEELVYFIRDFNDYQIKVEGNNIFVVDKSSTPNILYLIDTNESTRTNVYEDDYIELGNSTPAGYIVFAAGSNAINSNLKYLNYNNLEIKEFPFDAELSNFIFNKQGVAYFISDTEFTNGEFNKIETEITSINDLTISLIEGKNINLFKWDGRYVLLKELTGEKVAGAQRIEFNNEESVIRALVEDKYYDIRNI